MPNLPHPTPIRVIGVPAPVLLPSRVAGACVLCALLLLVAVSVSVLVVVAFNPKAVTFKAASVTDLVSL